MFYRRLVCFRIGFRPKKVGNPLGGMEHINNVFGAISAMTTFTTTLITTQMTILPRA